MHVAINRLRVPSEYAEHLERAFGHASGLADVPGFRSFKFLKNEQGDEYLVLTEWDSRGDFEAWTHSDAFSRAHSATNPNSPVKSQLSNYEVLIERTAGGQPAPPLSEQQVHES